jgi:hypothetical protein
MELKYNAEYCLTLDIQRTQWEDSKDVRISSDIEPVFISYKEIGEYGCVDFWFIMQDGNPLLIKHTIEEDGYSDFEGLPLTKSNEYLTDIEDYKDVDCVNKDLGQYFNYGCTKNGVTIYKDYYIAAVNGKIYIIEQIDETSYHGGEMQEERDERTVYEIIDADFDVESTLELFDIQNYQIE